MRTAVVIYNLGGPDSLEAVQPFLFNLFNDPLILHQPAPFRWLLAKLISSRRAPVARGIYEQMGGRSPILPETEDQARALEKALDDGDSRVFVAMRYWHPFAAECVAAVKAYDPDRIVLLPLYPQFSTTTTESFRRVWQMAAREAGLDRPTVSICCYPREAGFIDTLVRLTRKELEALDADMPVRVLFSAHGLPKKFVTAGDPYQAQVEMTVAAVIERLAIPDLDYAICYQSRVGPVEWLRPYTDDEVRRAGRDGRALVVVPVAFVSEHSETLVELDSEYRHLAQECGVPDYRRAPTVSIDPAFIDGLVRLVRAAAGKGVWPGAGHRICPVAGKACPMSAGGS